MIKNIIFDFGDVFINLDKEVIFREIERFGGTSEVTDAILELNLAYEIGSISSDTFIDGLQRAYPTAKPKDIIHIWNAMLLDFPDYRLEFLELLAQSSQYRLFLLSNTNAIHIKHVEKAIGTAKFTRFKNCFEKFYLSHEIQLRKPNPEIFWYVLKENKLNAEQTLFIDDTLENIDAAKALGIKTWHLQVGIEDVIDLKKKL